MRSWLLAALLVACGNDHALLGDGDGGVGGDAPPPNGMSVHVLAPNGGESFYQTQSATVMWTAHSDAGGTLTCDVVASDGTNMVPIASAVTIANDGTGTADWSLASVPPGFAYKIVVTVRDARSLVASDASDTTFAVSGPPRAVSLAGELQPVMSARCTTAGCHGNVATQEGLKLTDAATSYATLVGVTSTECSSLARVAPGDPDHSFLVIKLLGSTGAPCFFGTKMPKGGTPLTLSEIQAFRDWIVNGAPNN
jgi:hypothetical protein